MHAAGPPGLVGRRQDRSPEGRAKSKGAAAMAATPLVFPDSG